MEDSYGDLMDIVESLVKTIEKDGIILQDRQDVYNSISDSIDAGQFEFIVKDGNNIGFYSWEIWKPNNIFINNLFIYRNHRGVFNIISLRKIFRSRYSEIGAFHWKSRKRNKPVKFNEKRMALC